MFFSKNYINQNQSKQHKQNGAGQYIIQCCAHNSPLLHQNPGSCDGNNCGYGINWKQAFSPADSDKDIVDHVDFRADSSADKQNYEMQLISAKACKLSI